MKDAVILLILGMGTVFILLYVINILIVILGKLFGPKKKKQSEPPAVTSAPAAPAPNDPAMDPQLLVALTAAVAAYLDDNSGQVRLVVRPVETSAAWSQTGRIERLI